MEDNVDLISISIFKDPKSETDVSRKTGRLAEGMESNTCPLCPVSMGGKWEFVAAGRPQVV